MFIKLQSAQADEFVWVNVDHIEQIFRPEALNDNERQGVTAKDSFPNANAVLKLSTTYSFVKESPDEIMAMVNPNG